MATATFLATSGTDWFSAANWQNSAAAHLGDKVTISASAAMGAGEYYYGNSTMTNASLSLQAGTALAFSQLVMKNGAISGGTLEGTQLYVYGTASVQNTVLQSDVVSGSLLAADLGVSGYLTTLDNFYGPGGVWVTHTLAVTGTTSLMGNGITLQNAVVSFSTGANPGQLTVQNGATLGAASGTGTAASVIGAGSLDNEGALAVEAGATLQVLAALTNNGTMLVAAGGLLELDGTVASAGLAGLSGGGQVLVGGVVDNRGAVLDMATLTGVSAAFGDVAGGGTLRGGTLRASGKVVKASATGTATVLDGVAVQGLLDFTGSVKLTNGTSLAGLSAGSAGAVKVENGTLLLDGYASFGNAAVELANGTLAATAQTQLAASAPVTVSGNAVVDRSVTVAGTVAVADGMVLSLGDTSTAATTAVTLGRGSVAKAAHTVAGTTRFGGTLGTLELTGTGALSATLGGFAAGNQVRLDGMGAGTLSLSGSTLTVVGGGTTATLTLTGGGTYAAGEFQLATGSGGALVLTTSHVLAGTDNPLFDRAYYTAQYGAQVAASGLDAWQHYLQVGAKAGLNPNAWFDTAFYLKQHPDVAASGVNPLLQYEAGGWRDGRATSLLFSGTAYWAANPGMAGTNPLLDMTQSTAGTAAATATGMPAGGTADPLVQASLIFAAMGATLLPTSNAGAMATALYKSGGWTSLVNPDAMFDATFYMNTHRAEVLASGLDPLTHYETVGWRQGYDPSLLFSTSGYLAAHPGAASSSVDPLTASLTATQQTAKVAVASTSATRIDPLLDTALVAKQIATLLPSGGADPAAVNKAYQQGAWKVVTQPNVLFNSSYYLASNPDVAKAGIDPLAHYENFGWREGRNPDPLFDERYYLATNPDVAKAGVNPLMHFETFGWKEGRNPDPLFDTKYYLSHNPGVASAGINPLVDFETTGWQAGRNPDALFDVNYYLAHNPDVAAAHIDPLIHYDQFGWKEGRNPSASFSTTDYLNANRDVRAAGIDPLAHYLASGINEGRAIYAVK